MLAMGRGKEAEALRDFERALEADPGCHEARRYRAILLERALAEGADPAKAAADPDLAGLRRLPRFRRLLGPRRAAGEASASGPR